MSRLPERTFTGYEIDFEAVARQRITEFRRSQQRRARRAIDELRDIDVDTLDHTARVLLDRINALMDIIEE